MLWYSVKHQTWIILYNFLLKNLKCGFIKVRDTKKLKEIKTQRRDDKYQGQSM